MTADAGKKNLPSAFPWYLGVLFAFIWFGRLVAQNMQNPAIAHWQYAYAALSASLLLIALFDRFGIPAADLAFWDRPALRIADWGAALLMGLASLAAALLTSSSRILLVIATSVGAIALGWLYCRWSRFFALCGPQEATSGILCVAILWPLCEAVLAAIPAGITAGAIAIAPAISAAMLEGARRRTSESSAGNCALFPLRNRAILRRAWLTLFSISSISSVFLCAQGQSTTLLFGSWDPLVMRLATSVACALVALWALRTDWTFGFSLFWKVMACVLGFGYMLSAIPESAPVAQFFMRIAPGMLVPMVWLAVCDIARRSDRPVFIACLGLSAYSLAVFTGTTVEQCLASVVPLPTLKIVMLFALLLTVAMLLETRDPDMARIFSEMRSKTFQPAEFTTIDGKCAEAGQSFGLTDREIEIMTLVCKGHSRSFIAEALYITENTVKSHVAHIYGKLDVHSRKELQQLIGL